MGALPRTEVKFYFALWIGGIFYASYNVYTASQRFYKYFHEDDMAKGWEWLNTHRDVADYEWQEWLPLLLHIFPWLVLWLIGTEIARWKYSETVEQLWGILVSLIFLNHIIGFTLTAASVLYLIIIFDACRRGGLKAVWLLSGTSMYGLTFIYFEGYPAPAQYMWHVATAWLMLRCVSFCVDTKKSGSFSGVPTSKLCIEMLSYSFHLPTMITGPFVPYALFIQRDPQLVSWSSLSQRIKQLLKDIVRYSFWAFFLNVSLHFLFYNALQINTQVLQILDPWPMNGVAFCAGQFFGVKYVVVYGMAIAFAKADGRKAPPTPRCVARISLYSDMWRKFDKGYHIFLVRYIYGPLMSQGQGILWRFGCSAISFLFVAIWHGGSMWTCIWASFNFLGVAIEHLGKLAVAHPKYQALESKLGPNNVLRWRALAAAPMFIMSAFANFYFFGGKETAKILLSQIFTGPPLRVACLLLFAYFGCQVSNEIDRWEKSRDTAEKKLN